MFQHRPQKLRVTRFLVNRRNGGKTSRLASLSVSNTVKPTKTGVNIGSVFPPWSELRDEELKTYASYGGHGR